MTSEPINRRDLLKRSSKTAIAAGAIHSFYVPKSSHSANDAIRVGLIGCGGRGRRLMVLTKEIDPSIEFVAVSDAYQPKREMGNEIAGEQAKAYVDYRGLLDRNDIDAVFIATPEHLHGTQLIAAVEAGKDAYVEKPMAFSVEEGVTIIKAVRKSDRIVQVGMQRRSAPMCIEAKQLIDQGVLGDVTLVRAQWYWHVNPLNPNVKMQGEFDWDLFLGPAPKRPFDPRRAIQWNWYWDYSAGMITGQGVHLLDLIQWFMGKGTPRSAVMQGGSYRLGGECPDVFSASYEYDGFTASWILSYNNSFDNGWKVTFQGTKGTLVIGEPIFAEGERGYRIYKEPWRDLENRKPTHKNEDGLPTEPHLTNWIHCMRSRKEPNAPVEVGHSSSAVCHLAKLAYLNKTVAKLDKDCTKVTL